MFSRYFCVLRSCIRGIFTFAGVVTFVQLPVKVEHSCAAMDNASNPLTVVTELETVLMAVMRLDVVSDHSWTILIAAIAYYL